jgi:hypothetical protein
MYYYFFLNLVLYFLAIYLASTFSVFEVRRKILYTANFFLFLYVSYYTNYQALIMIALSTLHSLVHQHIPFISEKGLNLSYSAFYDVVVHLCMHIYIIYLTIAHIELLTLTVLSFIAAGSVYNVYVARNAIVNEIKFVNSSIFQALSSGAWISLIVYQDPLPQDFEYFLLFTIFVGGLNWLLFRHNHSALNSMFRGSYFDTFFIFPVYICLLRTL